MVNKCVVCAEGEAAFKLREMARLACAGDISVAIHSVLFRSLFPNGKWDGNELDLLLERRGAVWFSLSGEAYARFRAIGDLRGVRDNDDLFSRLVHEQIA